MIYKCECCYKEFEANGVYVNNSPAFCAECEEKVYRYGGYKVKCGNPDCHNEFYVPVRATKTKLCPKCRYYEKKEKARIRKRKQRENEKMSRLQSGHHNT